MHSHHQVFHKLLETELARSVMPAAGSDAARQAVGVALQELQRLQLDARLMPGLRERAAAEYRALLPELRARLDAATASGIERALDGGDWAALDAALGAALAALQGDDAARRLAGRLVAIDARIRVAKETAWRARATAAPEAEEGGGLGELDAAQRGRLLDFLRQRFPRERDLDLVAVKPLNGGFSKQTLFVDLGGVAELPSRLVMRRDPPYVTQGTSVTMEFPILEKVHAAGVSVPRPYAVESSGEVLGTPFMLVSMIPGRILGDFLLVHEPSRALALDMARQVARLHRVPVDGLEDLLPGGRMTPRQRVLGEIERHEAMWRQVEQQRPHVVQAALDWLKRNIDLADGPRALVHRDIGLHNLLVENDAVAAFLDWETVVVGTPGEDVAYGYYQVVQMADWADYLAAYEQAAGIRLDPRQLDFFMLWASLRIAIGLYSMVDPVYAGRRSNLLHFYLGDYFGQTLLERTAAKLAEVLA